MKSMILVLAAILATDFAQAQTPRPRPSGRTNEKQTPPPGGRPNPAPPAQDRPLQDDTANRAQARQMLSTLLEGYPEAKIPTAKFNILAEANHDLQRDNVSIDYIRAIGRALDAEKSGESIFTIENIVKTYRHFSESRNYEILGDEKLEVLLKIVNAYASKVTENGGLAEQYPLLDAAREILSSHVEEEADMKAIIDSLKKHEGLFALMGPSKGSGPVWKKDGGKGAP